MRFLTPLKTILIAALITTSACDRDRQTASTDVSESDQARREIAAMEPRGDVPVDPATLFASPKGNQVWIGIGAHHEHRVSVRLDRRPPACASLYWTQLRKITFEWNVAREPTVARQVSTPWAFDGPKVYQHQAEEVGTDGVKRLVLNDTPEDGFFDGPFPFGAPEEQRQAQAMGQERLRTQDWRSYLIRYLSDGAVLQQRGLPVDTIAKDQIPDVTRFETRRAFEIDLICVDRDRREQALGHFIHETRTLVDRDKGIDGGPRKGSLGAFRSGPGSVWLSMAGGRPDAAKP